LILISSHWNEASVTHPDGSDRRMLMVCQIKKAHQNNWARTPYIPVNGAQRSLQHLINAIISILVYNRSCEDVPNVATCKETFNLYYYETDETKQPLLFPPWREGTYIKVDTIAADKRFGPGSKETNFETRDIGPLTKRGIYLAIQDTGACMALMHVRVYYKYCGPTEKNLAFFQRTIAGPYMSSLEETNGTCVVNSIPDNGERATLRCNSEGEWIVPKGSCLCFPWVWTGLYQDLLIKDTTNQAWGIVLAECVLLTAIQEITAQLNVSVCRVIIEHSLTMHLCQPPSRPVNLHAVVNQTTARLSWERPYNDGGRDDLTYRIECMRCQAGFLACGPCEDGVDYKPRQTNIAVTNVLVRDLSAYAYYKFKVFALNGASWVAQLDPAEADVNVETNEAGKSYELIIMNIILNCFLFHIVPTMVLGLRVSEVSQTEVLLTWNNPEKMNGKIRQYEVSLDLINLMGEVLYMNLLNTTTKRSMRITGLKENSVYAVKVRASTDAGYGPYSVPLKFSPLASTTPAPKTSADHVGTIQIIVAVIAGFCIVVAIMLIVFCCRRKSQKHKSKLDLEKVPMFVMGHVKNGTLSYIPSHKTYIDPTTYEDPARAVLDFTKEIEASYVAIEEVIGGGEFGEVCLGRMRSPNTKNETDVAIKTLKSGYSTQQKLDFLGEASIMGQFDHPNVIRLEGVVTKSQPHMIITEFMENGSLDTFLRKRDGEFTVIQLVGILRNIAAGMKYLSDMGYVHRDLAARNILVNAQLICKVSDFGLSRVLEESSDSTYTTRGGKIPIRWTAPEAITYRKFTSASDVWSYGIVMWEVMSYGERPYWGMSNQDVIHAVGTGYRLPAPMDCPQVQHKLMLDCWKKDRNERPKFGQVVASLDRMIREPEQLKAIAG
uniref:receptor protein-tyrosine kinase n=1 Tax=Ciona savignyi TaxID=51511 RepID=H2ZQS0_CIOSA